MQSLKKRSWMAGGSRDDLLNRSDDAVCASMSASNRTLSPEDNHSSSRLKSDSDLARDPAFGNDFDSVPFIDGTPRNVVDAVCQTDPVFLPEAGYLLQQSCLSSEVFPVLLSNHAPESCETDIPNSSLAVYSNHSDLHLQSEAGQKTRSSPSDSKRNSVSIPLSHLAPDEATDALPKAETQKYKSPFTYASPYSSCAARRTSLRSPSLWGNENVTLNCLASSPIDTRRKSYVTPTFGGNDENFKLPSRLSLPQSACLWSDHYGTESKSLKLLPKLSADRIVENQPYECSSLPQLANLNDAPKKLSQINPTNDLSCDCNSLPSLVNNPCTSHHHSHSMENLDDSFSASDQLKIDPHVILRDYVAGNNKYHLSRRAYLPSKSDSHNGNGISLHSCTKTQGKPKPSFSSWCSDAKPPASLLSSHVDSANFTSNVYSTGSNLGCSCSPDQKRMSIIDARLKVMPEQLAAAREVLAKQADAESSEESARVLQQTITLDASAASGASEASGVAPPSPLMRSSKPPTGASPSYIIASLDKSILQIRDWLTVVEQMCRQQTVVVGDLADIRTMTEKQRNVLRELEGKKPQLDDLVASADSLRDDSAKLGTKPQQSVAKLREHWDETNSAVLARKTQLDAMLADSHKLETKRSEVEAWLARMEHRLERSQALGHTPDMIDQQIREQKGQQAELQQYKHQMELLNQQTQRLLTIYQQDDTRLLRRRGEALNARFNNLQSNIAMRGKALHSAVNSNSNFDKALEKFFCWLNEAEASTASVDLDSAPDKVASAAGPLSQRRDLGRHVTHIKDLQSEIESHKDVVASLNATGQKLLGTLENQDEAMMLHRRLEEMNTRWNTLKHRSIAIRSRLEGNTESWNSLLLSLRELIEWVIRKDTELTAMGPPSGDIATLTKLESDLVSFRRVLDEKQPVVESNLKSGRQLIASEPPLSDTSDSETGRDLDGDARRHGEESARELTRSVRREVAKLSEKWAALRERAAAMATNISLANKKLGVLQKTLEEVDGRLDVAEGTVSNWGPVPQDSNLAEQHVHNVTKFREGLSDLQRGVDDVNDQAARFSAHNIPLAADTSTRLHRLNARWKQVEGIVNDRWRQVAGRSRDVTPLTPAQLGSSVSHPWERAVANNKVPYYINHAQETTYWDHPEMMSLLDELADLNHIKFSAYRTAAKLRALQKKLALDQATLQLVTDVFDEHGLRGQNDRLIEVSDMVVVLSTLYCRIASDRPDVNTSLTTDLCLNWLLNVYDSQRTGQMRVLSFRVGLVCLCKGHLEEKYRYVFRLIADPNRLVDQRKLGLLLHDCVQVPRQLGEVAAFGGSNIEPSVRSCFTKAGKDRETIEAVHFLSWVQQEPQSLVWLAVLHRVAASEHIQHQVKCNICKTCPIVGLRYRCLKCIGFDMCQKCFFEGRSSKSHKITHPMHEYCTATTAGDEMKDFTKALKNKFKSKRSLQKHTKKGYLPVQTVLEGDPLESPSPSPQHGVSSQDMHNRLEQYASRLAEVELRTNSNSTPDSEDEHGLIAQYCQSLSSGDGAALPVPRSPLQVMAAVDADQKDELEQMIRELEEENQALQAEYEQLRLQQEPSDSPQSSGGSPLRSEAEMLAEARLLRQHKGRLEARMTILEQHNQQLEAQLHRLRQLLQQNGGSSMNKSGTLQTKSVTASQLATDSPAKVNGHSGQGAGGPSTSSYEGLDQVSEYVRPPPPPMGNVAHVGNLFSRAGDLERAVGSLVATVTHDQERDSRNGSRQASEGREDEPFPVPQLDHEIEQYDNNPMPAEKDR